MAEQMGTFSCIDVMWCCPLSDCYWGDCNCLNSFFVFLPLQAIIQLWLERSAMLASSMAMRCAGLLVLLACSHGEAQPVVNVGSLLSSHSISDPVWCARDALLDRLCLQHARCAQCSSMLCSISLSMQQQPASCMAVAVCRPV